MKLFSLFAVLVIVTQAPVNAPRQGGNQQDHATHDATKGDTTSPPLAHTPVEFRPVFQAPKWEPKYDAAQQKPGYWKEAFGPTYAGNWALVLVGGIAGWLAWRTLNAIKRQTDLMREQSDTARQKERPKLRIELGQVNLDLTDSPDMVIIECKIQNHGGSVAFISGGGYKCWIGRPSESEGPKTASIPLTLPEVLITGGEPYDPVIFLPDDDRVVDWTLWNNNDPRVESVRKGDQSVYLIGSVMYTNVFNETWVLKFRRKYTIFHYGNDFPDGMWSKYGAETENEEQQTWRIIEPTKRWWQFWISLPTASQRPD